MRLASSMVKQKGLITSYKYSNTAQGVFRSDVSSDAGSEAWGEV
jgi:hypothetical protein